MATPAASATPPKPSSTTMMLDSTILPALRVARAGASGIGVPGVELAINGVLELATMLSTMKSNKEDLSKLQKSLDTLITIDSSGATGDLKQRLNKLSLELQVIALQCKSLGDKGRLKRFLKSTEYKQSIEDIKDLVTSYIRDFMLYGSISIETIVQEMASNVRMIDRKIDSVHVKVQGIDTKTDIVNTTVHGIGEKFDNNKMKEILARLKSVAARYNAANTPDTCTDGTRVDLIKDIVVRLTSTPESTRVVMLSGVAGSGKSTIAKSVATILAEEKGALAGSFFFSQDYAERKEIKHLATTLARQLADYNTNFRTHLIQLLKTDRTGILEAEPHLQFQKLVVDILGRLRPSSEPWVICLDALDECGQDRGQIFLRWLSDSIARIPAHIHFFLTGRPDVPSYLKFDTLHSLMHGIILSDVDPVQVQQDIRLYVEQSLNGANWTTRHPWKIQGQDVEKITAHANGLFIFAATAVRYVRVGLPQVLPQESVDYLLGGEPLTDLYGLYHRIVDDAIPLPPQGDRRAKSSHDRAMKILSTILHLLEPLDSPSLAALLELDAEVLLGTLLPLSAVIHVSDSPGAAIRIIHLSFREFMTSYIQTTRPEILCGTEDQQRFLAAALMKLMYKELKFNICDLPTSYLRNIDMPDLQWRLDTFIPLHLQYACQFWLDHVSATSYKTDTAEIIQDLLFSKFLFWLEVLSLSGIVDRGPRALSKLSAWANKYTSLVQFATDAKRFISFFHEPIAQSAPHIYLSALALAPTDSEISRRFSHQFPQLLSVTIGQMKSWPDIIAVLEGHTNFVHTVAVSPDGRYIVSGSSDKTLHIWDAETGAAVREPLHGHNGAAISAAFSPDGTKMVSGSYDYTVRIWDAETGAVVKDPLQGHTNEVTCVAFASDGKQIASGSRDYTVGIWDAETGAAVREPLQGHTHYVTSVAFSPDGMHIVSGSEDHTVRIWDTETGAAVGKPLCGHNGWVTSVAFSPDGKRIVSGSHDKTVCIWDAETGAAVKEPLQAHTDHVTSVAFSPDGKQIVSGSEDHTVRIWDTETGAAVGKPLCGHNGWVTSVTFTPDGKRIVSGSYDNTVCIWDAETRAAVKDPLQGHTNEVTCVAFTSDGKRIVSGSRDYTVGIWDAETGAAALEPLQGHTHYVTSVAFSPDGKHIVSGSEDHTVRIWDTKTGAAVGKPLRGHNGWVTSVAFSPDGKQIVSGSGDHTVCIWDTETEAAVREPLPGHTGWVTSVIFSPNGKRIVLGSHDKTVCIWDAETGAAVGEPLKGHTNWVTSVAFSPDGKQIVSGSYDKTLCIWDAETGAAVREPLCGHTGWVTSVAFSLDGRQIVSGSNDKTVRIWDAETGVAFREPLHGHTGYVTSVAFSFDGRQIVSGSEDSTVRIWDAETGAAVREPLQGHTQPVSSAVSSPGGLQTMSAGPEDTMNPGWDADCVPNGAHLLQNSTTVSGWHLINSLHLKSPTTPLCWQINSGWASCIFPELLFWIPVSMRIGLWSPYNTQVIGREQTKLSYEQFVHGTDWAKCYTQSESI